MLCRDDSAKKHRNKNLDPMLFGTAAYVGKTSDDGKRNNKQHEGKGREMAGP